MFLLHIWIPWSLRNNLQRWKFTTAHKTENGGMKTDAIDVLCHGLDIAYLKAIIVESNYRINGITRYQRGLAAYQFLMRISQCWIDWVRIIKCKPIFNGLIMMICRVPLEDQRLIIIIIIVIRIHHPPLLFRGCAWFGEWVSWAFTFRGTCPPNGCVFILFHHVLIAIDAQDAFPCCIQDEGAISPVV